MKQYEKNSYQYEEIKQNVVSKDTDSSSYNIWKWNNGQLIKQDNSIQKKNNKLENNRQDEENELSETNWRNFDAGSTITSIFGSMGSGYENTRFGHMCGRFGGYYDLENYTKWGTLFE